MPKAGDRAKGGGDRAKGGDGQGWRRSRRCGRSGAWPAAAGGGRDSAFGDVSSGRAANGASARGKHEHGRRLRGGGGAPAVRRRRRIRGGGGGGFGGGGGRGGGGGGRRSDIALKHDVVLLGHLDNGLGYYRFSYLGSQQAYVGVMAQEVQTVMPEAVTRGSDGYLRVYYEGSA